MIISNLILISDQDEKWKRNSEVQNTTINLTGMDYYFFNTFLYLLLLLWVLITCVQTDIKKKKTCEINYPGAEWDFLGYWMQFSAATANLVINSLIYFPSGSVKDSSGSATQICLLVRKWNIFIWRYIRSKTLEVVYSGSLWNTFVYKVAMCYCSIFIYNVVNLCLASV